MITPNFSGHHVRSEPQLDHRVEHQRLPGTPESRRRDKTKPKGHILIQKHGNERYSHGGRAENSPHTKRREFRKNFHEPTQSSTSPTKQHFHIVHELQNVSEKLGLCYEQLRSGYMREISRNVALNAADSGITVVKFICKFEYQIKRDINNNYPHKIDVIHQRLSSG
jgi:hypothetical protein